MKKISIALLMMVFLSLSIQVNAQDGTDVWITDNIGNFFLILVAGILLAFAFQFILTNIAVALGISIIGDVREMGKDSNTSSSKDENSAPGKTGVKISSGFGVFMMLTMAISLFFASMIAVKLSLIPDNYVGFTLGLVIWAGYLLLVLYVDSKIISSLTGAVFSSVKGVLSAGASAFSEIFGSSTKSTMKETARETIKTISEEIRQEFDLSDFQDKLGEYINKLEPQQTDMDNIHEKLAELLNNIEIKEQYTPDDPDATKRIFLEIAEKQPNFTSKDKEKMKSAFAKAREIMNREGTKTEKAMAAVDVLTPGNEEEGRKYREKVEQYLRNTGREELNPDKLKEDLQKMFDDPKATPEILRARVSQIDRSTLKAVLSTRKGITEEMAEKYLSKAEEILSMIRSKAGDTKAKAEEGANAAGQVATDAKAKMTEWKAKTEENIMNWFNRMNQPELQYDKLKRDFVRIMDDPKSAPGILKKRLSHMDRDSLVALVSNNKRISREQAEKAIQNIEEARDEVIRKVEQIEEKVKQKLQEVKDEGLKQVEGARKIAAAAAWWLFIAAVVSGGASALGGMLAL